MTEAFSPIAAAIAELLADPTVRAITTRIRPIEPAAGDALGPGLYIPFVVVSMLDPGLIARLGISDSTLGIRAYAESYAKAEVLWLACQAVFINRGARMAASRLGIYHSQVVGGGTPDHDPIPPVGTGQPLYHGIVNYPTAIAAIPA
jgi:hypothetical protein